ncbi:MAG: DUF2235 domain-containing protein [Pseudomonadota bacterium]
MRNLVVCADGTWNTLENEDEGDPAPTNVARIFAAAPDIDSGNGTHQLTYYHEGVGTQGGIIARLLGGGIGLGLNQNIMSGFKWLSVNYKPDDRIFLFGFSRGAYTVRALAGMMNQSGLIDFSSADMSDHKIWNQVEAVFARYKNKAGHSHERALRNASFHTDADVHFMGVWDTVGSLGIPDHLGWLNLLDNPSRYKFLNTVLGENVKHARHAVAIDEMRQSFTPTLWTELDGSRDVKQVWFTGVHSDVGGGYAENELADITLSWMLKEAKQKGLKLRSGLEDQIKGNPQGLLHNSLTGVFKKLQSRPRSIPAISQRTAKATVDGSVFERQKNSPLSGINYRATKVLKKNETAKLDIFAVRPWNETGVFLQAGKQYRFSASGEWLDASIKAGPEGTGDRNFQPGQIAHLAGGTFGLAEALFRRVTSNKQAEFAMTRREGKMPWFSLVGVVANGKGTDESGNPSQHESFLIGAGTEFTPEQDGYLYCFANDAWQYYHNNRGSVSLSITCRD